MADMGDTNFVMFRGSSCLLDGKDIQLSTCNMYVHIGHIGVCCGIAAAKGFSPSRQVLPAPMGFCSFKFHGVFSGKRRN